MIDVSIASSIAPLVSKAANQGDPCATRILEKAGYELGIMAITVSNRLRLCGEKHMVGCVGSVFKSETVIDSFRRTVEKELKNVKIKGPYVGTTPIIAPAIMAYKRMNPKISEKFLEALEKRVTQCLEKRRKG